MCGFVPGFFFFFVTVVVLFRPRVTRGLGAIWTHEIFAGGQRGRVEVRRWMYLT